MVGDSSTGSTADEARRRWVEDRPIPREPEVPPLSEAEIEAIGRAVFVDCRPAPSDLIFVLGTSTGRWELVAQLYASGLAPRVMTTGRRGLAYFDEGIPLARQIRDALIGLGVPDEVILVSDTSDHTGDDVKHGMALAQASDVACDRVLFVCKAHHAGRVRRTFERWSPETALSCATYDAEYEEGTVRAADWWREPASRSRVYGEWLRIRHFFGTEAGP